MAFVIRAWKATPVSYDEPPGLGGDTGVRGGKRAKPGRQGVGGAWEARAWHGSGRFPVPEWARALRPDLTPILGVKIRPRKVQTKG